MNFPAEDEAVSRAREVAERGKAVHAEWEQGFAAWAAANPERKTLFDRLAVARTASGRLGGGDPMTPPTRRRAWPPGAPPALSCPRSRRCCQNCGAAPPTWPNPTSGIEGQAIEYVPVEHQTKMWPGNPYGRTLHFGIREHGMGSILNGIALHGGTRPYGGPFLVFSDYMRPAVRLAALMEQPVTYVWTHDSIGLGEDGPTHQPVEHRGRCATSWASTWCAPPTRTRPPRPGGPSSAHRPARPPVPDPGRNVPVFDREKYGPADGTARGAYVLADSDSGQPDVILIGTGSEVQIAVHARELLAAEGISARVVSMPCVEWFHEQDASYQEEVLPAAVRARVSVKAGVAAPWKQFVSNASKEEPRRGRPLRRVGLVHEAVRGVRADGGAGSRSRQDQPVQDQKLRSLIRLSVIRKEHGHE